jgi:phosphonoacetaldehyde hydrolase
MTYRNLKAIIFDWAGTIFDFGSHAPMGAFVRLFEQAGITVSIEDARGPMGLPKWDHIKALGQLPHVQRQWQQVHGQVMTDNDVDRLYKIFTPMNASAVRDHAKMIDGVIPLVERLRRDGLKIGTTTGYNRAIMDVVLPLARAQGFEPDNLVCSDDLPASRPAPYGIYQCLLDLQVYPARAVVKVDDTVPGLMEGRQAGCFTVGVLLSGNEAGLTAGQISQCTEVELEQIRQRVRARLAEAKPDFFVDTVADLEPILRQIDIMA